MREARSTIPVAQAFQRHSGGWKPSIPKETPAAGEREAPPPREPPIVDEN
jgi:hypothetical protein